MESKLISVIVPVYNVEKYINECIESIINQTYKNIEIILVDDGSKDSSPFLCDLYAKKDKRIKVLHKSNGGLSDARNAGFRIAKGEYVGFVDSDDWIDSDMYKILYEAIISKNADIACAGKHIVRSSKKIQTMQNAEKEMIFNTKEAINEILTLNSIDVSVCDKLFRRDVIEELLFPVHEINEDVIYTIQAFSKSNRIVHVGMPLYYYRSRQGSITFRATYSVKHRIYYQNLLRVESVLFKNELLSMEIMDIYKCFVVLYLLAVIEQTPLTNESRNDKLIYKQILKSSIKSYLCCKNISLKKKVSALLFLFNLHSIYTKIFYIYKGR